MDHLKQIASDYMQIWSAGNEGLLDTFADKDLTVDYTHFDEPYEGISEYRSMLEQTYTYFPDLEITLHNILPSETENSVMVVWEYTGTHQNGNLFGVEASGKEVAIQGMTLLKIEAGKVVREEGIVDNLSLMMQLGAL